MEIANIKDKLCLTKLTFYNRATALVDKGRVADITYLDLCKTLTVIHDNRVSELEVHRFDG